MSKKKTDLILENVRIEAVAAEGKALAHVDGQVLFVEFIRPDYRPGRMLRFEKELLKRYFPLPLILLHLQEPLK